MTSDVTSDVAARQKIQAALDATMFVEAGAGTGKTSALVGRVVELVATGRALLTEIVAITFTEAAAAELRERIRHALERETLDVSAASDRRERCRDALKVVDDAAMQTIHAFAQRLLQRHATEAGLPPVFEVADRVDARLRFHRRWRSFVARTLASPTPLSENDDILLRMALAMGARHTQLRRMAEQLQERWHLLDVALREPLETPPALPDSRSLIEALDGVLDRIGECTDETDAMFRRLREIETWRARLVSARTSGNVYTTIEALVEAPASRAPGNKNNWPNGSLPAIRSDLDSIAGLADEMVAAHRAWVLDGLIHLLGRFVLDGAAERRAAGVLEFHDLLVYARDLVRDDAAVRRKCRAAFRYVLVDEFQDTDPLQAELVTLLCREDGGSWRDGTLFAVGDPKQSIYRFRQADPTRYAALKEQLSEAHVSLDTNFRSLSGVIAWVNETFRVLLEHSLPGPWQSLSNGRVDDGHAGPGSVTLLGNPIEKEAMRTPALRTLEATEVVARIVDAKENGWAVCDQHGERPVRYRDMAVLMPTRIGLPALERALREASVPFRIESRSLVWSTQEVRDVLSVLRAVDDPTDEISLVAALRSMAFGCGDDELADWRRRGGAWDYRRPSPADVPEHHPIVCAMQELRNWHEARWWMSVPELMAEVMSERQMFASAFVNVRQREAWARLRFVIDQARCWTEAGGSGLCSFLRWASTQVVEGADALESVVPESDDDAVRVMTIHAAKGLEFPVVFVTGINSTSTRAESARVLWDDEGRPQVRLGRAAVGWETAGFSVADALDKDADADERRRLLYVAATRARDHLVVSVYHLATRHYSAHSCLAAQLLDATSAESWVSAPAVMRSVVDDPPLVQPVSVTRSGDRRSAALARGSAPVALSATTIARRVAGDDALLPVSIVRDRAGHDDLAVRLAFGRAVHWALERVDFADPGDVESLAARAGELEGLSDRTDDILRSLVMAFESSPIREAVEGKRLWKEVFVAGTIRETVIEGYIDLLYEGADGLVIVDYKTDEAEDPAAITRLVDHYRWQLLTYAAALEQTLGRPVARAVLLMISPFNTSALVAPVTPLAESRSQIEKRLPHVFTATA